jgi:pimeloyl-ACP methyl ester carboxylesterase
MGLSSFNPQGTFRTFGEDVTMLAMHLKIEATEVLCWSGAGPYALALAYHFPKFICSVHIISGFTRSFSEKGVFKNMNGNVYYFAASKYMSPLMKGIMTWAGRQKPNKPLPQWLSKLPDADHALMTHSHAMQHLSTVTLNEAARNGSKGLVHEASQYFQETGYILSQIQQPVHYWWGTLDNTVTRVHAEAIDKQVPKGIVHYKDNEGHLSIYINYFEEVLAQIAYDK